MGVVISGDFPCVGARFHPVTLGEPGQSVSGGEKDSKTRRYEEAAVEQLKGQGERMQHRGEAREETARTRRPVQSETPDRTGEDPDAESHIIRGLD